MSEKKPSEKRETPVLATKPKRIQMESFKGDARQRELLRLCVHEPHSVARYIRGDAFTHPVYREIFDSLVEHENIENSLSSLRDEAGDLLTQIMVEDVAHVEEISPYSLDVFSRVVETQMKDFLHQLVLQGADNTAQVKKLLDAMASSLERGDGHMIIDAANRLLDLRSDFDSEMKNSEK